MPASGLEDCYHAWQSSLKRLYDVHLIHREWQEDERGRMSFLYHRTISRQCLRYLSPEDFSNEKREKGSTSRFPFVSLLCDHVIRDWVITRGNDSKRDTLIQSSHQKFWLSFQWERKNKRRGWTRQRDSAEQVTPCHYLFSLLSSVFSVVFHNRTKK